MNVNGYCIISYDTDIGVRIFNTYDDFEQAKAHADRVQALKDVQFAYVIKPDVLYSGQGLNFIRENIGQGKVDDNWYKTEDNYSSAVA